MIVFLVLAHQTDLRHYAYWNRIAGNDSYRVFVHVDKSASVDIDYLKSHFTSLDVLSLQYVYWADRSMVDATIATLREALDNVDAERFFLLSADSILLQDEVSILEFCKRYETYVVGSKNDTYQKRSNKYYFLKSNRYSKRLLARALDRLILFFQFFDRRTPFSGCLKGPQWLLLNRSEAEAALEVYEKFGSHLDYTNCADEFFFQNVVPESSLRSPDSQKLIYTKWEKKNSPEFLCREDIERARDEGYLFARKVRH